MNELLDQPIDAQGRPQISKHQLRFLRGAWGALLLFVLLYALSIMKAGQGYERFIQFGLMGLLTVALLGQLPALLHRLA